MTLVADRLKDGDTTTASRSLTCSLLIALAGGLVVCCVLQLWGPRLLAATGAEAALLPYSLRYLRIRCSVGGHDLPPHPLAGSYA